MPTDPRPQERPENSPLPVCLEATIPADVEQIAPLVQRILGIAREKQAVPGKEDEVGLALQEALANAVRYGARSDPTKTVSCTVSCGNPGGMLIVIRDPGEGFDPDSVPNPMLGDNVFSDHGRGLHMIRALMDEVHWERNGTEIHMRKY